MNTCNKLLEQAEALKKGLNGRNGVSEDGSSSGELVTHRTNLQDVYRRLLITNLEFALDKKTEQDLWNLVFKNHITTLQQKLKDKSNTHRSEAQSQLSSFLDSASGFYHQLLHDLCHTFHVNLPCRVNNSKLLLLKDTPLKKRSTTHPPERPSCQYMCQHCLVHLGDIARYRNQIGQAESYYRHAAQLVPSNGQPYNQLAILASAGGDVLSTAFYYCRSLAVKCPFPGSDTNLRRQLSKILGGEEPRHGKISTSELIKYLLKFHASIYLQRNEGELLVMVGRLSSYLHAHLRAGSLSRQQISHMTFLNLFSLNHLSPIGVDGSGSPLVTPGDENDEGKPNTRWSAMLMFTMQMLHGLLSCIPVHSDDPDDMEHPGLPSVKLTLDWLTTNASVLQRDEVAKNSRVWHRLAQILNALGGQDKANNMEGRPLSEDYEVRGFIGLKQPLNKLDFVAGLESNIDEDMQHPCRCYRLYKLGVAVVELSDGLMSCNEDLSGTIFECLVPPTHAMGVNGEMDEVDDGGEHEESSSPTPVIKEVRISDPPSRRGAGRGEEGGIRKKNRAPRMQYAVMQDKSEAKLKVIKEEDTPTSDGFFHDDVDLDSMGSSQGESPETHPRTHKVTFATPQMSPPQYLPEDSPSPTYPDQVGVIGVFPEPPIQQPYVHNMVVSQQMGQMYRHPAAPGNPLQYPRHPMDTPFVYHHPHTMLHRQPPPFHPQRPTHTPPLPADLPKPLFYQPQSDTFRSPLGVSPSEYDPHPDPPPRPTDIGRLLRAPPQPPSPNMEGRITHLAPRFHTDMAQMHHQMKELARTSELQAELAKLNHTRSDYAAMAQQQMYMQGGAIVGSPYERDYDIMNERQRGLFKFGPGGGSNETSSTSSPTPGGAGGQQVSTTTCSPQAGSINNYKGVGSILVNPMMDKPMEIPRRPNGLPPQTRPYIANIPKQVTPPGLSHFDPQPQHGDIYPRERMRPPSMFGISPNPNSQLNDDMRYRPSDQSPSSERYPPFNDRVKTMFKDLPNVDMAPPKTIDPLLHQQSNKEKEDSYKLFPDHDDSSWLSQRNRGDELGLSNLGSIGSERAAHMSQYSPWGAPPSVEGRGQVRGNLPETSMSNSFWSTPMVPSGPSALEMLLQRQNHNAPRDPP